MRAEQVLRDATRAYGEQIQPTQEWQQIEEAINTRSRRVPRRAWVAVSAVAASVAVLVTAAAIVTEDGDQVEVGQVAANGPEGWSELAPPPDELAQRDLYGSVWTGEELIIWGGVNGDAPQSDGFAYDLETDSWRRVPDAPIEGAYPTVMWTGEEVLVWIRMRPFMGRFATGLQAIEGSPPPAAVGAAYDPASDTWRALAAPPDDVGALGELLWVDGRVVATAAGPWMEYDPARDRWRELDGVTGTGGAVASAAGSRVLVWTPWDDPGIAYDLREGEATTMPPLPEPLGLPVFWHWAGSELIVWGDAVRPEPIGFAYDPEVGHWRRIPQAPLSRRSRTDFGTSAWTGRELILWGGKLGGDVLSDGAAYDPAADRWRELPDPPGSRDRYSGDGLTRTVAAWTGTELLIAQGDSFVAYRPGNQSEGL